MSLADEIYCYTCNKSIVAREEKDPDLTVWKCPLCERVLDSSFTDEEMEWEDEDADE